MATGPWRWLRFAILALLIEKILQHLIVTLAFVLNWSDIAATVSVSPGVLTVLGAIVALLYLLAFCAMLDHKAWAASLIIGLAAFDLVGECLAQGTMIISVTVSFVVAGVLLILAVIFRRRTSGSHYAA
jgi:hypothetical protein